MNQRITFQVTKDLAAFLHSNDYLGFDTAAQAADAILTHADFTERWEFNNFGDEMIALLWKCNTLIGQLQPINELEYE